jgi:hypothetical protein
MIVGDSGCLATNDKKAIDNEKAIDNKEYNHVTNTAWSRLGDLGCTGNNPKLCDPSRFQLMYQWLRFRGRVLTVPATTSGPNLWKPAASRKD